MPYFAQFGVVVLAGAFLSMNAMVLQLSGATSSNRAPSQTGAVASPEPGWPQWRGPRRDGVCDETGLLPRWPDQGPKLLWQIQGLGRGYSCPIISQDRLFITGDFGDQLLIIALDMDGKTIWRTPNGNSWKGSYPGARACVAISEGRVYHLNAHGRLACLEATNGAELWAIETLKEFAGQNLTWAISECLLVDEQKVYVTPGGRKGLMAALDKKTGKTVWTSEPLRFNAQGKLVKIQPDGEGSSIDSAGYASPVLCQIKGRKIVVNCSLQHMVGIDAESGRLLWSIPYPSRYQVIACTPVLLEEAIFISCPDSQGGTLFRLDAKTQAPDTIWISNLDTCHGGVVCVSNALYGSYYRSVKGWGCLNAADGTVSYQTKDLAMGSVLYANGRLYCLGQDGIMALINPTVQGFEFCGRFQLAPQANGDAWTHPVIHGQRLYLRYHETLYCYDVKFQNQ